MPRLEACLVDAYDTIVTCDFSILRNELSALAGISPDVWQVEYARIGALVSDGRLSKAEAFERLLRAAGQEARPGLVAELVRQDTELLLAHARLFDDVIPFLRGLRERGIKVAIVSNCAENTRPLLVKHGIDALADDAGAVVRGTFGQAGGEDFPVRSRPARSGRGGGRLRGRPAGLLRGQRGRGHPRGADPSEGNWTGSFPAAGTTVVRSLPEVEALFGE